MAFELNRIDGTPALPEVRPENVSVRDGEATLEVPLAANNYLEFFFPAPGGATKPGWLDLARRVLTHLTAMDDEVQRASAEQWAGSPYPSSYYEGDLAFVTLVTPREAALRYSARGCNAEWDERFVWAADRWVRVAGAEPACCQGSVLDVRAGPTATTPRGRPA